MPSFPGLVDASAARLSDPRFNGVTRIDLRARYSAPQDGLIHPLSDMGLAAALKLFPSIGLDANTDLSKWSQDDAGAAQAEFEVRTGAGGIIGLAEGGRPMLTRQLVIQQSFKTWLHGARDTLINTRACGTTPAIRLSGNRTGKNTLPLCDIEVTTAPTVGPSNSGGGAAYTGFLSGASAFQFDNAVAAKYERVAWSGYDKPFVWGDEVYNIEFENWSAGSNNIGINWDPTGADSMERIQFCNGCSSNNNYGVFWNTGSPGLSQGGSIFFKGSSFDYNIIRQIHYLGLPDNLYNAQNGLHLIGNHIETTGACSGSNPRLHASGSVFLSDNEFYEGDGQLPTGFVDLAAFTSGTGNGNRMGADRVPLFITAAPSLYVRVEGSGNVGQNPNQPVYLLKAADGTFLQPSCMDNMVLEIKADPNPLRIEQWRSYVCVNYPNAGSFTLPNKAQADIPLGAVIQVENIGSTTVTFAGAIYGTSGTRLAPGGIARLRKYDPNYFFLSGTGLS